MDRFSEIKARITACAEADDDIRAVAVIGSIARKKNTADEFSDLDLIIVSRAPEKWHTGEYQKKIGNVEISFTEQSPGGVPERRTTFEGGFDVDIVCVSPEQLAIMIDSGIAGATTFRGYTVLYDPDSLFSGQSEALEHGSQDPHITAEEFENMVSDFYFHIVWSAKYLLRHELWTAVLCTDAYLKHMLFRMIELYSHDIQGKDTWHNGRFLDTWADRFILDGLEKCFAHYDGQDVRTALYESHRLFSLLSRKIARYHGFNYPEAAEKYAYNFLNERLG